MSVSVIKYHADALLEKIGDAQHLIAEGDNLGALVRIQSAEFHAKVISDRCEEYVGEFETIRDAVVSITNIVGDRKSKEKEND